MSTRTLQQMEKVATQQASNVALAQSIRQSNTAKNTFNPIRNIVEKIKITPNPQKKMITLTIGDPTRSGCFTVPHFINDRIHSNLDAFTYNGYEASTGIVTAREAVAQKCSVDNYPVGVQDVLLASGCSQALDLAIAAVANPGGDVVLLPRPGFPLYRTICDSRGISTRYYDLDPSKDWEVNLEHLKSLFDSSVKLLLVSSPGNPTGAVYSRQHLKEILRVAEEFKVPILSDEVYAHMAFRPFQYYSMASLSSTVPIIEVGGLAKRFMVPGWRLGWIVIHDRLESLSEIREGLHNLSQIILGPSTLIQSVVAPLLYETPESYFKETLESLQQRADTVVEALHDIPGLKVLSPQGAMYCMVQIDPSKLGCKDDVIFTQKLLEEESVFVLPGQCFQIPNFFRIVTANSIPSLKEACHRIRLFCEKHHQK
ncbi:putative Tyrosine aminotransferase [Cardiosporidium cionae]|uniref:Tyrosine aminotransferase n=1 Tax=Cardiosporidium cionae TaxID=476202 RepID=A0ABQ7J9K9_9APIC|nr:putative Tyrosine aminotransferase [Cardiosporidium cionae]|eukprot:KAF8820619.1 putative Tyrosine aminotransferase [Cardiosporidium cionae]